MADLPARSASGRSGVAANAIVARARVALTVTTKSIREDLAHVVGDMGRKELTKIAGTYSCLPECYYNGAQPIGPDQMAGVWQAAAHGHEPSAPGSAQLWELCSGSSVLSAAARAAGISHLPPIDFRYGWSLARAADQVIILYCLLFVGD